MSTLRFVRIPLIVAAFCAWAAIASAQTLTTLLTFNGINGGDPGALIQRTNGNLLAIASQDGIELGGVILEITTLGAVVGHYDFNYSDLSGGAIPVGGLLQAVNRKFYGMTGEGGTGASQAGTVFQLGDDGHVTTLYSFCSQPDCTDGAYPNSGLIQARNGNFYGTTYEGGTNRKCTYEACGVVFEITPSGKLTVLYNFCSQANCADGSVPFSGLAQGRDGNFYGVTWAGGNTNCAGGGCGTIFKLTPAGQLTTLHTFCNKKGCIDGAMPGAALVQGSDGSFYGTTTQGGVPSGVCFANTYGCGTAFKISSSGEFTTLYIFCSKTGCADGTAPDASLIQGSDGNLYGSTYFGGANGFFYGTIFQLTPAGTLTTLHSFCSQTNCADGVSPFAALLQTDDGTFYGTTSGGGGEYGYGTVFNLEAGSGPER